MLENDPMPTKDHLSYCSTGYMLVIQVLHGWQMFEESRGDSPERSS